jgi:2-C-methyl-D-erythritol 2,4-cyclodiphosphate synthase
MSYTAAQFVPFRYRTGLGRSMKRFGPASQAKPCIMGGIIIDDTPGFIGKTDGDVIIEALVSAISTISPFDWRKAQQNIETQGITSSHELLAHGLKALHPQKITSIAICIEGKIPLINENMAQAIKNNLSHLTSLDEKEIGITSLAGDGLDECGCGEGVDCIVTITTIETQ